MKKLSVIFLFFISLIAYSQKLENNELEKFAKDFYKVNYYLECEDCILNQKNIYFENAQFFTAFNFRNGGFVIFSNDSRFPAIFAYSMEGIFDFDKCSDSEKYWWKYLSDAMNKAISQNDISYPEKHKSWEKIENGEFIVNSSKNNYLLTTAWGQGCYYNSLCPEDENAVGLCGHVATGCVATAMAQIMKYWNYPEYGSGTNSYNHPVYGNLSADFGNTQYQWSLMEDQLFDENFAVAQLMYHCGVAVNMNYGPYGSGAVANPQALENYFLYSLNAEKRYSYNYSADEWKTLLREQIDNLWPVLYVGSSQIISSGHAWVVDGYDNNDYFHFNWGWDSPGGFYLLDDHMYSSNQLAIMNIFPSKQTDVAVTEFISPESSTFIDISYIKVKISNYGLQTVSNIPISYVIDNNVFVNEIVNVTLQRGESIIYEFNTPYDFSQNPGHTYNIKVFTDYLTDEYKNNDTVIKSILNIACVNIPYTTNDLEGTLGWTVSDVNNDGNTWILNYTGIASYGSNQNQANDWLFSRCLNLEAGKLYKISFDYRTAGNYWYNDLSVLLLSYSHPDSVISELISLENLNNYDWENAEIDFLVNETATYYIGFKITSQPNMLSLVVNNFSIEVLEQTDLIAQSIISPISSCDLDNEEVIFQFKNYCSSTLNQIPLKYQINNAQIIQEIFTEQILPGEVITYSFNTFADLSQHGDYQIKVWLDFPSDVNRSNDTVVSFIKNLASSSIPYSIGFESPQEYEDWVIENLNNDNKTWEYIQNQSFYCNSGSGCVRYVYNDFLPADDWLISKCVWMESGYIYRLSFYYRVESDYWPENLKVLMGQGQTNSVMNILLGDFPNLTNTNYQQATLYFPIWEDGYYYFGFHCYSAEQMFNLYLDDIEIDIEEVNKLSNGLAEDFMIYPNPATDIVRIFSSGELYEDIAIEIIDISGKIMLKRCFNQNDIVLNIEELNEGLYFVKLKSRDRTAVLRFIKL